mgnify:CR=1 FL=1
MPEFKKNTKPAVKRSGFKMKGYSYPGTSPMRDEKKTTRSGESTGVTTTKPDVHWNAGAVNTSGTRIVDEKGNWTSTSGVRGKQLRAKYARTNYANTANTPSGDVVNVDTTKYTRQ